MNTVLHPAVRRTATTTVWAALDIETCPLPAPSAAARERLATEIARHGDEARAASLHPLLAYVCAVGIAVQRTADAAPQARTFAAPTPDDEARMLDDLWRYVARAEQYARSQRLRLRWTTFNGKAFDVPMLRLRSMVHGIPLPESGLFDVYPYRAAPHFDLMGQLLTGRFAFTLGQLCDLLGVPSPKADLDGSGVAAAISAGQGEAVAAYAARDATATLALARRCAELLGV